MKNKVTSLYFVEATAHAISCWISWLILSWFSWAELLWSAAFLFFFYLLPLRKAHSFGCLPFCMFWTFGTCWYQLVFLLVWVTLVFKFFRLYAGIWFCLFCDFRFFLCTMLKFERRNKLILLISNSITLAIVLFIIVFCVLAVPFSYVTILY